MMAISDHTIIITGAIALGLFFILLVIILVKYYQRWKSAKHSARKRDQKLIAKTGRIKTSELIMPEFKPKFLTSPYRIQLPIANQYTHHKTYCPDYQYLHSKFSEDTFAISGSKKKGRRKRRLSEQVLESSEDDIYERVRGRRVLSDPGIFMPLNMDPQDKSIREHTKGQKRRTQSEVSPPFRGRRSGQSSFCSTPPPLLLSETSGQLEFLLFYDANKRSLEITVIQVFDIDIRPELFVGRCEIVNMEEIGTDTEKSCLMHIPDESLMFSNKGVLGLSVNVEMFPRKTLIGSTSVKYGLDNPSFNESFALLNYSLDSLVENRLRFQVMVQYGVDAQPLVLGETVLPMKNLKNNRLISYQQFLQLPVDEMKLESTSGCDMHLGQLTVAMCYKLHNQQLNVKVVCGKDLPRIRICGQPSTSVKVSVYFCGYRLFKEYTAVKKKTSEPIYNESFDFDIAQDKLPQTAVLLEVRHHGAMHRTVLGYVHIGNEADGPGHDQWDEILDFAEYNKEHDHEIVKKKSAKIT